MKKELVFAEKVSQIYVTSEGQEGELWLTRLRTNYIGQSVLGYSFCKGISGASDFYVQESIDLAIEHIQDKYPENTIFIRESVINISKIINGNKMKLPNVPAPCDQCPFRKDTLKGWLVDKIEVILSSDSFTCHKTSHPKRLQCAGHMLLKGDDNVFVRTAKAKGIDLPLKGRELIFDSEQDCINHHKY